MQCSASAVVYSVYSVSSVNYGGVDVDVDHRPETGIRGEEIEQQYGYGYGAWDVRPALHAQWGWDEMDGYVKRKLFLCCE